MFYAVRMTTGVLTLLLCLSISAEGSPFTFDSDAQGWTSTVPTEVSWAPTDGNPGGYLRFEDGSETLAFVIAPASLLGNWFDVERILYDHKIFYTGTIDGYIEYEILISGPGGSARWIGSEPQLPAGAWYGVVAPIDEWDWTVESGNWAALLADVTDLRIRIEGVENPIPQDITGIDNIDVQRRPPPVPTMSEWGLVVMTLIMLLTGTLAIKRRLGSISAV